MIRTFADAMAFLASFTDWEQLLHRAPSRTTFDLGRLERLLARLGDPHRGRPVIHVTGTKGKSSVTAAADAVLRCHGLRTFRFLSPHVRSVRERLAVDGEPVDGPTFAALVEELRPEAERLREHAPEDLPSFFEMMTVMGFLIARDRDVDALVLEVGLGGRLDATNVVTPTVAVVTTVALDHTRILGSTIEEIAREKAGILKPGRPVVTGLTEGHPAWPIVRDRAESLGCEITRPGDGLHLADVQEVLSPEGGPSLLITGTAGPIALNEVTLRAGPPHQATNALLAVAAATEVLAVTATAPDPQLVANALRDLHLPGRSHWVPGDPPLFVDGAHTAESVADFARVAQRVAAGRPLHLLCGLTRDRDPGKVLSPLVSVAESVTATDLDTPRGLPASDIAASLNRASERTVAQAEPDPNRALATARTAARADGGIVVVCGSLYLAGHVLG